MLHHSRDKKHSHVWTKDFEILGSNYSFTTKGKISESLFIREYNPTMNTQETSYSLTLFNSPFKTLRELFFLCVCNIILVVYAFIYSPDDAVWMYSEILLTLSMDVER